MGYVTTRTIGTANIEWAPLRGRTLGQNETTGHIYTFNGSDQYAVIGSDYSCLGDPTAYTKIYYKPAAGDGYEIDATEPIGEFARVGANYHAGPLYELRIRDCTPGQNRFVCVGDQSRYVQLDSPVLLSDVNNYEFEFFWRRYDSSSGTGLTKLFGSDDGNTVFYITDSGNGVPDSCKLQTAGANVNWSTAHFADISQGQICHVKVTKTGDEFTLYLDGVLKQTLTIAATGLVTVDRIGRADFNALPANGVIGDLKFNNISTGDTWFYRLEKEV